MATRRVLKKLQLIFISAASRMAISFGSVLISLVVIHTQSPKLWGAVVYYLILIDFAFSVIGWGATPYLVRDFSLRPKNMTPIWSQSVTSRIPLLLAFVIIIGFLP